jgi:hypothetical protein
MNTRERVMRDRNTPHLTKEILKLMEGHDISHCILAIKIVQSVLKAELADQQPPEILDRLPCMWPPKS